MGYRVLYILFHTNFQDFLKKKIITFMILLLSNYPIDVN